MKTRLLTMFLSLSLAAGTAAGQQPDSLSLDDMIALVLRNNPSVHEAEKGIDASQAAAETARSGFYPDAKADLAYTRLGPIAEIAFPGAGTFELFPANNYDAHLSVRQKVYDFDKTSASADLASSRIALAQDRLEQVQRDLAYVTVQSFYTVLYLDQGIRVQDDQIDALNQYLSFTQKKLQAGTATDFDVLTTRVRIAAAQDQKIDLLNRLRKEQVSLRRLADMSADAPLRLHGTLALEPTGMQADSLFGAAERQRIDIKQSGDAVVSAELQRRVAARTDNPSVDVNLAYGVKNGYIPNLDVLRGNFVANVSVQVPIFNGFKSTNLEQEAQSNLLAAQDRKRSVETTVRADISDALSDLRSNLEKLQTSKLNVELAQHAVDLAKAKYDAGVITNLDLLDAQTALEQAKLNDLQTLYGFVLSRYRLKRAVGDRIW